MGHPYDIDFEKHAVAVIMKCPNKDACGWTAYSTQAPLPMPHAWTSDPAGHKLIGTDGKLNSTAGDGERAHACAAGYKGLLCAECDGNYTGAYWDEARLPHSLDLARCCPATGSMKMLKVALGWGKATLAAGSMRTHGAWTQSRVLTPRRFCDCGLPQGQNDGAPDPRRWYGSSKFANGAALAKRTLTACACLGPCGGWV